ncbi:MAG: phosphotransferase [Lachnospiraceae bacterium]|nr:phosphotransferase [Lachnospiraceae bacterium]
MTAKETQMIQEALQFYHFEKTEFSFIRHNENITCKVTADGNDYVLRIHFPMDGFSLKLFEQGPAESLIRSEIALLLHLSKAAPFPVQKPVQNKFGEYISVLSCGVPAELLQWVDGETLPDKDISQYAKELGTLAAQINSATQGFTGERISYSYGLVQRMKSEFAIAQEKSHITQEESSVCCAVLTAIEHIMAELDKQPNSKCLIHADLSPDNIIITSVGLAPIDFSLSGFGYRAQECGMLAFSYDSEEEREIVRTSYEKASGVEIKRQHMNAFGIFSILAFIASQHDRYWTEAWFQESMKKWTSTLFADLLNALAITSH